MAATKAVKRPHWYRITVTECPACGAASTDRERIYGKPPRDEADRHVYEQAGCAQGGACYSWL